MSILPAASPKGFELFKRSMIQSANLPLAEVIDSALLADAFEEDRVRFGIADEDVFTPAITLWAMVSQFLFTGKDRSCKVAAGRVVSLLAQTTGRVVAQNAGNDCRAKAKIPVDTIAKIARKLSSEAEQQADQWDNPYEPLEPDQAEDRLTPKVLHEIRSLPGVGRFVLVDGFTVDGFTVDGPDTPQNQAKSPQNPVQAEGLGFPILRCVVLISMITGPAVKEPERLQSCGDY